MAIFAYQLETNPCKTQVFAWFNDWFQYSILCNAADQSTPYLSDAIFPTFLYPLEHISNQPTDLFCTNAFLLLFLALIRVFCHLWALCFSKLLMTDSLLTLCKYGFSFTCANDTIQVLRLTYCVCLFLLNGNDHRSHCTGQQHLWPPVSTLNSCIRLTIEVKWCQWENRYTTRSQRESELIDCFTQMIR